MDRRFLEFLMQFISDNRKALFYNMADLRTRYITVVLEDLYQPHNASAIMRTCEGFGIQDIHVIENKNKWQSSRDVERGSSKWITINRYKSRSDNTGTCLHALKEKGYKLVATTPHTDNTIERLALDEPIALIFGNEKRGVSKQVLNNTDYNIKIPMYGFTESFNISVAAAICLHNLRQRLNERDIAWQLCEDEKTEVMLKWCKNTIENYAKYRNEYVERFNA